jgi:signal transduction histidine kinase
VLLVDAQGRVAASEPPALDGVAARPDVRVAIGDGRPLVIAGPTPSSLTLVVPPSPGSAALALVGRVDLRRPPWATALADAAPAHGWADLLDAGGYVQASTAPERLGRRPSTADETSSAAALAAAPLRVVLREPGEVSRAPVRRWRARFALASAALVLLAVVFAWGAGHSVIAPLAVLTREAERIAAGDLGRPLPELGEDQVGRLGRSFERMRQELSRALDAVLESRRDLAARVAERTAELETLYHALRRRDESRGHLLRRVIGAQEEERKRIARELHDDTCQALTVLGMRLDSLQDGCRGKARQGLAEARALAQRTTEGVHRLIFDLRPSVLDDLGLLAALRWLASRYLEPLGVAVRCEVEELDARLPSEVETALFRAAQEAVGNVARHAEARSVAIRARRAGEALEITIEDDGRGFAPADAMAAAPSGRGLGLLGMRERLALLGGAASIDSSPGHGTRVVLRAPLPVAAGHAHA